MKQSKINRASSVVYEPTVRRLCYPKKFIRQDWHNSPSRLLKATSIVRRLPVTVLRIESWPNYKGCGALMSQSPVLVEVAECVRNDTHNSGSLGSTEHFLLLC